jgi:hypothetical protein
VRFRENPHRQIRRPAARPGTLSVWRTPAPMDMDIPSLAILIAAVE